MARKHSHVRKILKNGGSMQIVLPPDLTANLHWQVGDIVVVEQWLHGLRISRPVEPSPPLDLGPYELPTLGL